MKQLLLLFLVAMIAIKEARSQNVGIGTTTPNGSAQLDVSSTNKGLLIPRMTQAQRLAIVTPPSNPPAAGLLVYETTTNSFWFYNGSVWNQIGTGGASPWTISGSNIYSSNTGNVGIGTATGLAEKLSVRGNLFVTHVNGNDLVNGGNRASLNLHGSGSGTGVVNFLEPDTTVGASIVYGAALNQLFIRNGANTNQLVLRSSGDIGVGTSNPTERLDVLGNIRSRDSITADDDIIAGDDVIATGTVQGNNLYVTGPSTLEGNVLLVGNINSTGTGSFNGNVITNAGMTINDAAGTLSFRTSGDDKGFVQLSDDNLRLGTYGTNTNGKFVIRTGGNDWVHVDGSGNVGLGIASPLSKIHIAAGADAGLSSHGYLMLGPVTGSNLIFDNNEIIARTNGQTGSLILQNDGGSVRIGNVAVPGGYKFAINGKMICEEVKVKLASTGWPDYVFADNYQLKSLQEIEKFIIQNKHLPNIPSAAEVEKNGIEIGDMQKRMMEKIEELTLYVIELEKKINELKNVKEK
jgi:hypothetical protein